MDCLGLLLIRSGQLRVYTLSSEGREITLYRLFEMDTCLFSASCVMPDIQFDVVVEAEKDSEFYILPSCLFKDLMEESVAIANYANQLISSRFSEVMWLMEQIMWKSFDKRLAKFLLEESELEGSLCLKITHEKIANHLGTAREVVTRMLRYFQSEGMVTLTRGAVELIDLAALEQLGGE
jgi:CRP/FNR family transcriptional regulator